MHNGPCVSGEGRACRGTAWLCWSDKLNRQLGSWPAVSSSARIEILLVNRNGRSQRSNGSESNTIAPDERRARLIRSERLLSFLSPSGIIQHAFPQISSIRWQPIVNIADRHFTAGCFLTQHHAWILGTICIKSRLILCTPNGWYIT